MYRTFGSSRLPMICVRSMSARSCACAGATTSTAQPIDASAIDANAMCLHSFSFLLTVIAGCLRFFRSATHFVTVASPPGDSAR